MIKRHFVTSGKWKKVRSVQYEGCCDCGLIHRVEDRSHKGFVETRVYRENDLTKQSRKQFKHPR